MSIPPRRPHGGAPSGSTLGSVKCNCRVGHHYRPFCSRSTGQGLRDLSVHESALIRKFTHREPGICRPGRRGICQERHHPSHPTSAARAACICRSAADRRPEVPPKPPPSPQTDHIAQNPIARHSNAHSCRSVVDFGANHRRVDSGLVKAVHSCLNRPQGRDGATKHGARQWHRSGPGCSCAGQHCW